LKSQKEEKTIERNKENYSKSVGLLKKISSLENLWEIWKLNWKWNYIRTI